MKHRLPERGPRDFAEICSRWLPDSEVEPCARRLQAHYATLRQWSQVHDLIGPGTYEDALSRHYEEALVAAPLIPAVGALLDLGSGAGFPGFVLACARPGLRTTLVEPRQKRAAFLRAAARAAGLELVVHAARLPLPLPQRLVGALDAVTVRALKVDAAVSAALVSRFTHHGRWYAWCGEETVLPEGLSLEKRLSIPGLDTAHVAVGARL